MPALRLIAWNCHHGSLAARLRLLRRRRPDIVFLQECRPVQQLSADSHFLRFTVNDKKGLALGSLNPEYQMMELSRREGCGGAVIAANVTGPLSFSLLGIWSQKISSAGYVDDVLRYLNAYRDVLRSQPCVVMGDLNSGPKMNRPSGVSPSHSRLLTAFAELDMVSAYHAFHNIEHGQERHHTYRHKPLKSEPWHIDFCFIPAGWSVNLTKVQLLDGSNWVRESDHHPLLVDLTFR